jgi:hypothetical protein
MNNNSNTRLSNFDVRASVSGTIGATAAEATLLLSQGTSNLANAAKRRSAVRCEPTTRIQKVAAFQASKLETSSVKGGSQQGERTERRTSEESISQRGQAKEGSFLRVISTENLSAENSSSTSSG